MPNVPEPVAEFLQGKRIAVAGVSREGGGPTHVLQFAGQDASKVDEVIEQLGALGPGIKLEVTVKEKRRPWWKFWGGKP